jgi:uncharacterized protein (TIGR01777 family)
MKPLRIILAGGSGHLGTVLAGHFHRAGHSVSILSRSQNSSPWPIVLWDGETLGDWALALEGADVLINLAGRSVNCRYTAANRASIMNSRVRSTRVLGEAISRLAEPPSLWINSSTATIYRHSMDRSMDEDTGEFGGHELGVPESWRFSIEVARSWEDAFFSAVTPRSRKIALRSAVVMGPEQGGAFDILLRLVRFGLGGTVASGDQYVSWVHDVDFARALDYLISNEKIEGPINVASPNPLPNRDFMRELRRAYGVKIGLPAPEWLLEVGTRLLQTESELVLKSRRVVPGRLVRSGFQFSFPDWPSAANDLVSRWRDSN